SGAAARPGPHAARSQRTAGRAAICHRGVAVRARDRPAATTDRGDRRRPHPEEHAMTSPTQDIQTLLPSVLDEAALKELGLSSQDLGRIAEASRALQDISPGNLHGYGKEAAARTTSFSTQLLDKVRNADLDSSGEKLGEVVRIARSLNLDAFGGRSKLPIVGPLIDRFKAGKAELVQRYSSTNKQIDQLMVDVATTQSTQQQRVREYDQMHAIV